MPAAANLTNLTPKAAEGAPAALPGAAELFASLLAGAATQPRGTAPVVPMQIDGAIMPVTAPAEPEDGASDAAILLPLIEQQRAQMPVPAPEALPETVSPVAPEAIAAPLTGAVGGEAEIAEGSSASGLAQTAVQIIPTAAPPKAGAPVRKDAGTDTTRVASATIPLAAPTQTGTPGTNASPMETTAGRRTAPLEMVAAAVPTGTSVGARTAPLPISATVAPMTDSAPQGPLSEMVSSSNGKKLSSQAAPVPPGDGAGQASRGRQPVVPTGSSTASGPVPGVSVAPVPAGETTSAPSLGGAAEASPRLHPVEAGPTPGPAKPIETAASEQPMRTEVIRALAAAAELMKTPASAGSPAKDAQKTSGDPAAPVTTTAQAKPLPAVMEHKSPEPAASPRIIDSRSDPQVELKSAVEMPAPAVTERPAAAPLPPLGPATAAAPQPAMAAPTLNLAAALAGQVLDMTRDGAWIDQLARDITRTASGDGSMRFRLAPETLGELRVEITQSERGAHVRLQVTSEAAQQALAEAQPKLAAEARAQGLRIAETEISFTGGQGDARDTGRHAQPQPENSPRAYRANSNQPGGAGASPDLPDRDGPRRHDRYA